MWSYLDTRPDAETLKQLLMAFNDPSWFTDSRSMDLRIFEAFDGRSVQKIRNEFGEEIQVADCPLPFLLIDGERYFYDRFTTMVSDASQEYLVRRTIEVPHYTTSIDAALEFTGRILGDSVSWRLTEKNPTPGTRQGWQVDRMQNGETIGTARETWAASAIVLLTIQALQLPTGILAVVGQPDAAPTGEAP
ncbi:hypothetical protein [Aureimonas sp. AU20]|uniref:hypothetical protein n=1 Tax=Aureimonas sp. AU20 TaxID=1349819 RepID=UPI000722C55E|nr:hypothetical protein [Aureimonas sp. AU20]ALN75747.1 hypothetical protein M673_23635 [Aureimonas sp. AU20]